MSKFYRVSIFNDSSWGGWITVLETDSLIAAEREKAKYLSKGYEASIESVNP